MKFLIICSCLLLGTFGIQTEAMGQKGKNNTEKQTTEPPSRFRSSLDLTVDQRAQMKTCPVHGIHMHLNRDYKANSDTVRQLADYPFAEQFHFRRHCRKCTRALHKEVKQFEKEERIANRSNGATFERCVIHNEQMQSNPDFSSFNSVKDTEENYPNARQYKHRLYCKSCTRAMKQNQNGESTDSEEKPAETNKEEK